MKSHCARISLITKSAGKRRKWTLFPRIALLVLPAVGLQLLSRELIGGTPAAPQGGLLYIVNTTSDTVVIGACQNGNPGCSLRGAIQTANSHPGFDGIDIDLPAGSVINLTAALPDFTESVTIFGPGANQVTVRRDTGGNYRIFTVSNGTNTGPTVSLTGLTIANGSAVGSTFPTYAGGGIFNNHGRLTLTDITLAGNNAKGFGGGIYNDGSGSGSSATITINDSTLSGNSVTDADGGGIFNNATNGGSATLTLTNSTLSGNNANTQSLGGGGIYNRADNGGSATVTLFNCMLIGNSSSSGGGGGIHNDGSIGASSGSARVIVNGSSFINNQASFGGGIYNGIATLMVSNSTFSGNMAQNGAAIFNSGVGGSTTPTVSNSTFSNNTASQNGGAIYNNGFFVTTNLIVQNSTVRDNTAEKGGGLYNAPQGNVSANLILRNSTVSGNGATTVGGGIYNDGSTSGSANLTLTNCTISANHASIVGGIYNDGSQNGHALVALGNTILRTGTAGVNILSNGSNGNVTSFGHNLSNDNAGGYLTATGDLINTDPMLDTNGLQNNGGPTQTIALLANSPAINAGNDATAPSLDQRYHLRSGVSDIGAFEFGGAASAALTPISVSRKTHGTTLFDIGLPLSGVLGIECRSGGATGDHQVILTFATPVTVNGNPQAQVTSGSGQIGTGGSPNGGVVDVNGAVVIVPLTNVNNAQTITIRLNNVNDGTNTNNVSIPMRVLLADTNANATVNASDISQTKSRVGQAITTANFRSDVNRNGAINASDVSLVKSQVGMGVP